MFDHVGLPVVDFKKSLRFYAAALEALGYRVEQQDEKAASAALGKAGAPQFYLSKGVKTPAVHLAFVAPDRESVRRFHKAALGAGGKDNGAAGPRTDYSPTYYAAFVLDPDGNNVEAVCHRADVK